MADEEDPVVQEFDVYLSKGLLEQLYLFQYPVRPASVVYDDVPHVAARVKPNQQKVELELALNTASCNYAHSKGEQIALNVDGNEEDMKDPYFNSDVMDKQTLTSNPNVRDLSQYAVGVLKNHEVHLTPLKSVVQLKPSFAYLDKADSRLKGETGGPTVADTGGDGEEAEATTVTVRYSRPESEEAKARRMASYEYLQRKQREETWIECDVHSIRSAESTDCYRQLFAQHSGDSSEFYMQPVQYMNVLVPPSTDKEEVKPAMPNNVLSMTQLKSMSLNDQVKALLINVKVIRFSQLMSLLPRGTDPDTCLRSLQVVAILVRGSWVVKSEILFPKDTFSANTGIPAEVLNRGRDFVLWRFTQNRYVIRKDLVSIIKLPSQDIKDILEQMSRVRVNLGWEFFMEYDKEFSDRYPQVVERHQKLWESKYRHLTEVLKITQEMQKKLLASAEPVPVVRHRTVSRSKSRSMSESSDIETEMAHKSQSEPNIKSAKTSRTNSGSRSPRTNNSKNPRRRNSSHIDSLENSSVKLLNYETNNENELNGTTEISFVPLPSALGKNSEDPVEFITELTNFLREKLFSRYVMCMTDLRRLLSVKLSQASPGYVLKSEEISDELLDTTIQSVGGTRLNIQWPDNRKPEIVFALAKTGDNLDEVRRVLFSMFEEAFKIKQASFKSLVESSVSRPTSDSECKKILQDYCEYKSPNWSLKGTMIPPSKQDDYASPRPYKRKSLKHSKHSKLNS